MRTRHLLAGLLLAISFVFLLNGAFSSLRVCVTSLSKVSAAAPPNTNEAVPIDFGAASDQCFLVLYGTGIRGRSESPTVAIGGEVMEVPFAGAQGGLVGLDQINLRMPRSLAGRGNVDVVLTADGRTANTVQVNFK